MVSLHAEVERPEGADGQVGVVRGGGRAAGVLSYTVQETEIDSLIYIREKHTLRKELFQVFLNCNNCSCYNFSSVPSYEGAIAQGILRTCM